jgi:60 kDa SS-A/Ro ribonucleoprotein
MVTAYLDAAVDAAPGAEIATTHAGGGAFSVDKWTRLRRFLILGTEGGTYYVDQRTLTADNIGVVRECLDEDWVRTIDEIVQISDSGRAPKNDPAILALALASTHENVQARRYAFLILPVVCRIGTHLLHFVAYREALGGGWGKLATTHVGKWFTDKDPKALAYQAVKYPSRDGWALRELLRLSHPSYSVPSLLSVATTYTTAQNNSLVRSYIARGSDALHEFPGVVRGQEWADFLAAVEVIRRSYKERAPSWIAEQIKTYRIPREALPTELLNEPLVWEALLDDMPLTAMIRNLGKMSNVGVIGPGSWGEGQVVHRLGNVEMLRKARVHPIAILAALKVYEQGRGEKGKLTWTPTRRIVGALDDAFYAAFGTITPTNKRIRLALDVSGSMEGASVNGMPFLTCRDAAAAMALITASTEPNADFVAFSGTMVPLPIRPTMRLTEVLRNMQQIPFGRTYCALPVLDAIQSKDRIDAFAVYTDSETMDGGAYREGWGFNARIVTLKNSSQALREYRQTLGIPARMAVVAFAANEFSIADPRDAGMLDVVGLDSATPALLAEFFAGAL